ncbi:D(2) dopamine receptor-like [Patiria miniata]|uniref:G-protein coupled receptors family 1 profile domain-containing protein n=1 Tax=Patiria miniata TaxID=46514 RepID=A0A914AYF6_PATMI|nr:D(2) dopamine receptor-like [Patiria miniata]
MPNLRSSNASIAPCTSGAENSCDTGILVFMLIFKAAVFVFGVPGNCLILRVYWTKARKTSTHVLIMALAWADLSVCLSMSINIVELALKCAGNGADSIFFSLIATFADKGVAVSLGITAVIAVDRYDCICRPQKRYCTPRRAKVAVFVVVLFSVMLGIPGGIREYLYPPILSIDLLEPIAETIAVLIAFVTIGLCYGKVYAAILKHVQVGGIPERTLTQDDQVTFNIDKDRTIPSTQRTSPVQLTTIRSPTTKRRNGSNRNSKTCSTQPLSDAPARVEANASIVDNEVSTINLPNTICTTHASFSRRKVLDIPQNANGKLVNPAERDSKVGLKSVSQAVSEQGCSKGEDTNHREATDAGRRHAPKRMGGAVLQRKTTKMLFITSVIFLLTWLPDLIDNAKEIAYLSDSNIDSTFSYISEWLSFTIFINNAINPLIYGLANKRFRKDCKEAFRKIRR